MFDRTLIITPHFDDETIGCGGLMSSLASQGKDILILVIASQKDTYNYSAGRIVPNEERYKECANALSKLGVSEMQLIQLKGFEDGKLDLCSMKDLVTTIDEYIRAFKPTTVLFPYSSHHQDHQAIYKASIAALRPTVDTNFIQLKAAYEYPYITTSWNSTMRSDSKLYYPLTERDIKNKRAALMEYKSQLTRDPKDILNIDSILNLAKVRGTEIGYEYAEAFYPISIIV